MTRGRKTGGKNWVKGQSGNPKGNPGLPGDCREAKKLTADKYIKIVNKMIHGTKADVQAVINDPFSSALELLIAGILAKAITQQDVQRATFILERLIGKVPNDAPSVNVNVNQPPTVVFSVEQKSNDDSE